MILSTYINHNESIKLVTPLLAPTRSYYYNKICEHTFLNSIRIYPNKMVLLKKLIGELVRFFYWEMKSAQGLTPNKAISLVETTNTLARNACKAC